MHIEYHLLDENNIALLENVGPDVFDNEVDPDQLKAFADDPRHILAFATHGGRVVGMASAVEYFHPDKQPQLWINEAGVATEYQNKGIGRHLLQDLLELGKQRGCVAAWLGTEHDNEPAKACYRAVPNGKAAEAFLLYEWNLQEN